MSTVTTSQVAQSALDTTQQKVQLAEDFDDFLSLLTIQLQNQDPLSPMESTEFTSQLVAFAGVEQQINANQKLDDMIQLQLGSIASVALGFVGMDASYVSDELNWDGSNPVNITYAFTDELPEQTKISIYNEAGDLVYFGDGGTELRNEFVWDGKTTGGAPTPPGTYEVKIGGINSKGGVVEDTTVVTGRVSGIETQDGIVYLLVGDRAVSLSNILNARLPEAAPAPTTDPSADDAA